MRGKLVFGLMCAACIVSCKQPEVKESGPRPVKVTKALPLNVVEKSFSGVVSPDQFSDLAFKMSGPLIALNVEEGQRVKKGQVVAVLDPLDFRLQYEAKKSSYMTAKSQMERSEKLIKKQAISHQDYESTQASYANAKAAYENAKNILDETKLLAPFDGFIQKKYVENYQKVQAGQGIVCLINPNKLLVKFTLPENNMQYLLASPQIAVEFENYRGRFFKAKVKEYIEASPDGSGVPVSLYVDDPDFNLNDYKVATGFSCRVVLKISREGYANYVQVPLTSVFMDPRTKEKRVFVYNDAAGKVEQRVVKEGGLVDKDMIIITEGLNPDEKVVIAGTTRLIDGQLVNVLTE
ncbi:efflux RND transporter periplasmic adaptor subunit [Culturomica massiliensis]|uniref:efflux RND transporter periplasmic adaptor subunit n=1 Tax=Culturomica massiliensis TaxID=1841857 RepID=UPI00266FC2C4|nr:efflux RND transporter periplasmic adaptor subunit [Culturomica massiliensis]